MWIVSRLAVLVELDELLEPGLLPLTLTKRWSRLLESYRGKATWKGMETDNV